MPERPGYVYVLSNPAMPGIVKIGMSTRSGRKRAAELYDSNTSVPLPFKVEFEIYSDKPAEHEELAHEEAQKFRVNEGREFFRMHTSYAIQIVARVCLYERSLDVCRDYLAEAEPDMQCAAYKAGLEFPDVLHSILYVDPQEWVAANNRRLDAERRCRGRRGEVIALPEPEKEEQRSEPWSTHQEK